MAKVKIGKKLGSKSKKTSLSSKIRTQEFKMVGGIGKKGYDPDEVREFLNRIAREVAELEKKVEEATGGGVSEEVVEQYKERVETLEAQLELLARENEELKRKLKEMAEREPEPAQTIDWDSIPEDKLATELLKMAKETGDRIVAQKRKEAEEILQKARAEAEELLKNARIEEMELQKRLSLLKAEIEKAKEERDAIRRSLKSDLLNIARKIEDFAATLE